MTPVPAFSARGHIRFAALTLAALVMGFGSWAVLTRISGAVIGAGHLEVMDHRQIVQHPDGGVIEAVLVKEGSQVTAGTALIRLEGAQLISELAMIENRYFEVIARRARLEAERDDTDRIRFPASLPGAAMGRDTLRAQIAGQERLLQARRDSAAGIVMQLQQRRVQIMTQIEGITAQIDALERQRALLAEDRATQAELLRKGLAPAAPLRALDRELARMEGQHGALRADRATAAERHAETGQQILSLSAQLREEAERDLREVSAQELELAERLRALRDKIARLDLRAPVDGVVYDLQVTTPRAVLRPAEPALFIIPQNRPLVIVARISPSAIDQVFLGQQGVVVFPGLSTRDAQPLIAEVVQISADVFSDPASGASYYRVELVLPPDSLAGFGPRLLMPGMPVEVFLQTGLRSPLSYLARPLTDFFTRALRES